METLTGLRVALNSWAAIPKDKVIGRSITGARQDKVTDGVGWGLGQEEGNLDPSFDREEFSEQKHQYSHLLIMQL